jgi:hypothetical protein
MTQVSIGIDPGAKGAIAAINAQTLEVIEVTDTPVMNKMYGISEMAAIIRRMSLLGVAVVTLEETHSRGFGIWEGILGALEVPYRTVRPIVWTKKVLAGVSGEGKERPISFALRMFPGCVLTLKGRADALCLAYYGTVA